MFPSPLERRDFLKLGAATLLRPAKAEPAARPIQVGRRRQLFLDDFWFDRQQGIELVPHRPVPREVALASDRPWETGSGVHQSSVLQDGSLFRMWYRSDEGPPDARSNRARVCYAESPDGIHWEKPSLGLVEREGSRRNNLLFPEENDPFDVDVIRDPNASPGEAYKMIARSRGGGSDQIVGFVSEDGLRWRKLPRPLIVDPPHDTHNILVWDDERLKYVIYLSGKDTSMQPRSYAMWRRCIRRSESQDFRDWSKPELVLTADDQDPDGIHFYNIAAEKYQRAARAYLMFPMVYYPGRIYPGAPHNGVSDIQFASSRDGIRWDRRFRRPLISQGLDERNWVDRNLIMGRGILETGSTELSTYYSERYRAGRGLSRLRRCTFRKDGFVSVRGPYAGWGEFTTKPIRFRGNRLELNYTTSGGGTVQVELQDSSGKPIPGFNLNECPPIFGDRVAATVPWRPGANTGSLSGKPIRMRLRLRDADVFAFRFHSDHG